MKSKYGLKTGMTLLMMILFCGANFVQATVPGQISYQGKLTDADGTPLNGTYTMRFALYDPLIGGTPAWSEEQSVVVTDGIYNVQLGAVSLLDSNVFAGDEVDLEISIYNADTTNWETLSPRQRLTSTAYAFQAENARALEGYGSADFASVGHQHSGGEITSGTVEEARIDPAIARDSEITWSNLSGVPSDIADGDDGIPTETDPTVDVSVKDGVSWGELSGIPLDIADGDNDSGGDITGVTAGSGLSGGGTSGNVTLNVSFAGSGSATTVARSDHGHWGQIWSGAGVGLILNSSNNDALRVSGGNDGVYVLSSGDDGVGVHSAGDDGVFVRSAGSPSSMLFSTEKNGFEVAGAEGNGLYVGQVDLHGVKVDSTHYDGVQVNSAGRYGVLVKSSGYEGVFVDSAGGDGVYVNSAGHPSSSASSILENGFEVEGAEGHGLYVGRADQQGVHVDSAGDDGIYVASAVDNGVQVYSAGGDGVYVNSAGNDGVVVRSAGSPSSTKYSPENNGFEVDGAEGHGLYVGRADRAGVRVDSAGPDGVYVLSAGGDGMHVESAGYYGVYVGWAGSYAGYFHGDVHVVGNITKGGGSFKIDHPLDPENKYLYHSLVESPDMKNIYDGTVTLDQNGEAWVELPEWFEALNREFRYQLTPIGAPMPYLYIGREIEDNTFQIAGGQPGMKVSWQVTGIRQDPYAEANRIIVEEDKPAEELGTYLHPEAYGMPKTKGLAYREAQEHLAREQGSL